MSQTNSIEYSLTINVENAKSEIRKLEASLMRILGFIERFTGGDPNLTKLIQLAQTTITTLRSLQIAIRAVQMASGPVGWLYAGNSILGAGLAGMSILEATTGA